MPYIHVKAYKKDDKTKQIVADKINEIFLEYWGCPQEAITVSIDEYEPKDWQEKIYDGEILPNKDKMLIDSGKKNY